MAATCAADADLIFVRDGRCGDAGRDARSIDGADECAAAVRGMGLTYDTALSQLRLPHGCLYSINPRVRTTRHNSRPESTWDCGKWDWLCMCRCQR